jgi:hypothetical protein
VIFYDKQPDIFALKSNMKHYIIGVLSLIFVFSCTTDDTVYEVGSDFIENNIQLRVIDTFAVKAGTFKIDSLITSSTNRILLGNVKDETLGSLTSKSYMQLVANTFTIDARAVYDSIGFVLNYDTYYYGDTTKVQTYKLHRITETVEPKDADNFYNTSSLVYDEAVLGQTSFIPNPNKATDSIFIKMDDILGEDIFTKIVDNDINTTDDFLQFFKGLAIVPDISENNHVLGFNAQSTANITGNSSMRLYYSINDDDSEDNSYYVDFTIPSADKQFNEIQTDLSNTIIGDFVDNEEIKLSENTNNSIFTQAGSGLTSRIEIPWIKKLAEISENVSTLSAILSFNPLKGSFNKSNPLPNTLSVYVVDHKNRILKQLTDIDGNVVTAFLFEEEDEFSENSYYSVDLSGFVEEILFSDINLNYALMIQYDNFSNNVNNIVIEHKPNTNKEIKLSVKYLNY